MKIGVRELRAHLSRYLEQVKAGSVVEVTDRGRTVARLMPVRGEADIPAALAALIADGSVSWSGERFRVAPPAVSLRPSAPRG